MPWCDECSRFWNPTSLTGEGACPACGRVVAPPAPDGDDDEFRAPWHFKLMVVLVVAYLGWRLVQLAGAVV